MHVKKFTRHIFRVVGWRKWEKRYRSKNSLSPTAYYKRKGKNYAYNRLPNHFYYNARSITRELQKGHNELVVAGSSSTFTRESKKYYIRKRKSHIWECSLF
uniref:Uncharacterized protein n=1 Tax=Rhizophagus irregularis (strain DAOM 181602 / DAOM 197198 / MUCL 43194) TaxID=747089 RepID=U9TGU9_RHIID